MEVIIGVYSYLTKIQFIELKRYFNAEYTRADYDFIIIKHDKSIIKISQDGLITLRKKCKIDEIDNLAKWFRHNILSHLNIFDEGDFQFTKLIQNKKPTIIILNPDQNIKDIYKKLERNYDYVFKSKNIVKYYGDGVAVFDKIKYKKKELDELIEYQMILADYQSLVRYLFIYNKHIVKKAAVLRKKEFVRFKEIPKIINDLIDQRKETITIYKKIIQLDDFIQQRGEKCNIIPILDEIKLNDFKEMIGLNNYIRDQFDLTMNYIASIVELSEFIYKDNEQKELNILQVIFAIGTIATIVSLGAMPGAKLFFEITGNSIVGEMISFNPAHLVYWTLISVGIGIVLFWILNYLFLYAKKLRMIKIKKD